MPWGSMAVQANEPLASFRLLSQGQDQALQRSRWSVNARCESTVEFASNSPARLNRAFLGTCTASYMASKGRVRVTPATPETCYSLVVPMQGVVDISMSEGSSAATCLRPFVRVPTAAARFVAIDAIFLVIDLPADEVAAKHGEPHNHISLRGEEATYASNLAKKLVRLADRIDRVASIQQLSFAQQHALMPQSVRQAAGQLADAVAAAAGGRVPENEPEFDGDGSAVPRWLRGISTLPATVQALSKRTGISIRVLQREFRKIGTNPRAFINALRLDRARDALEHPRANTTVADIASCCGIRHLGRFSQYYRERFGELPSATLANARRL